MEIKCYLAKNLQRNMIYVLVFSNLFSEIVCDGDNKRRIDYT